MIFAFRRCFVFSLVLLAVASIAQAQTDYFWLPPVGGNGTWDTTAGNFSDGVNTPPNYTWQNTGSERANFGGGTGATLGTVTLGVPITAYGINFATANYVINGGANPLTLVGPGGVINSSVAATINAQIAGNVGLSKTGSGALTLGTANTYSGGTTVTGGTLLGIAQTSGSPFSSGAVALNGAILQLKAVTASTSTTTSVGNLTIGAASAANVGASQLSVDNSLAGGSATTTFAAGNLIHGGVGSALVVTPVGGSLGGADIVTLTNGNSSLTNGVLPPWVVTSNGTGPADYVTYGGTGITTTAYFGGDLTTSNNTSVVNQTSSPVIAGDVNAYALRNSAPVDLATHTLNLGNGSGQSGLILNGGSITNGNISFGATEGVAFVQGATTLGSLGNTISSNGLTITALGSSNTTINSNIVNGTAASQVTFTGATSGTSLTLNGANTYTGGTILSVNTGSAGNVFIGSNTAFGAGKVTNIIVPGSSSDQLQASGGDRTLANPFDLNGGVVYTGTNSFTFTGPINIVNSLANGARTLQNAITTAGKTVTFGTAGSASTITIGNPVSNGGDGVGKNLIFSSNASSTTIINDVMQDPAAGGGTASASVTYSGSAGGVVQLNSLNTYSGSTFLNGGSTIQFNHDFNAGDPSGPFGVGTLTPNNSTNNILQPVAGDRVLANPVSLATGFTVNNSTSAGETARSLTLTGPISMTATGRTLQNNFTANTGGTLTLGSAGSPSVITGATVTNQTLQISGNGKTVINDSIQEVPGMATNLTINAGGIVTVNGVINTGGSTALSTGTVTISGGSTAVITFNAQNTYNGQTNLTGAGTIIPVTVSSNALPGAGFTSGPFGTGTLNFNNGTNQHIRPIGNQTISNPILLTTGIAMDNDPTSPSSNLTLAGPITMTNNRFISNGFTAGTTGGSLILGDPSAPSTVTLPTTTNFTLSFAALAGPIVVNDVLQDANFQSDNVTFNPNNTNNNPVILNAANTYSGVTTIGASAAASTGPVYLGTSTDADFGAISTGPFGKSSNVSFATNSNTNPALVPYNADRTLSNQLTLTGGATGGGLTAANAPGQTFNLNLTGPVFMGGNNVSVTNNMAAAAKLTLGSAGTPQTITLSQTVGKTLTFAGQNTSTTVVNDVIVNNGLSGNAGSVAVSGSIVNLVNANTYGIGGTVSTTVTGGTLLASNTSGSATGPGDVSVTGGAFGGNGSIDGSVAVTAGAIAPGNPAAAGSLHVGGNVSFGATGAFNVDIGGLSPGLGGYDQLVVGGTGDLTGAGVSTTLNINLLSGFSLPTSATDFTILTAALGVNKGSGFGFGTVNPPDASGRWTVIYNPNSIVVHLAAGLSGIAGDYNHNGVVDMSDYVLWRNTKGQTGAGLAADGNGDNVVDDADYSFWRARFGNVTGSGSGSGLGGGTAVPEPGLLSLLICAAGIFMGTSTRTGRRDGTSR